MKTTSQLVDKLNPYKMTDTEMAFATKELGKIWGTRICEQARDVVKQLGIGGLWRGAEASILIVAKAIQEKECPNCDWYKPSQRKWAMEVSNGN